MNSPLKSVTRAPPVNFVIGAGAKFRTGKARGTL